MNPVPFRTLVLLAALALLEVACAYHDGEPESDDFSNEWIVHLDGDSNEADLLALKLGYEMQGEVCFNLKFTISVNSDTEC